MYIYCEGQIEQTSEKVPWLVKSPAWMRTSPLGSRSVWLCVSEIQTNLTLVFRTVDSVSLEALIEMISQL